MTNKFQPGQRVRHAAKGIVGIVESVQHDSGQVIAPNETYTVLWDGDSQPEKLIYPGELEADDDQSTRR